MFGIGTEELNLVDRLSRDFASGELAGRREELERCTFEPEAAVQVYSKAWELGLFSLNYPPEKGGADDPVRTLCVVLRNLAAVEAGFAAAVFTHAFGCQVLREAGREDSGPLGEVSPGEPSLVSVPVFDRPEEVASRLTAERERGSWRLRGRVEYLPLGGVGRWALLPARTGEGVTSLFLCAAGGEDWRAGPPVVTLGLRSCPAVEVTVEGVPAELVGEEGKAGEYFDRAEDVLSPTAASICLGIMEGSLEEALDYARRRVQGGWEIINWSEVRMILSSMAVACRTVEMLVRDAVRGLEEDNGMGSQASRVSLLVAQDLVRQVTSDGIQLLGGNGYMKDYGQEKRFRDGHHLLSLLGHHPLRKMEILRFSAP
ncbi:MAG: acyl-CoA dehydrogenase family protein [Candidatus Geothermincolales bacterium]